MKTPEEGTLLHTTPFYQENKRQERLEFRVTHQVYQLAVSKIMSN